MPRQRGDLSLKSCMPQAFRRVCSIWCRAMARRWVKPFPRILAFDMVSFTGSTRAGILVAKAAADTVKRVHQELGGKSPNLVLPDALICLPFCLPPSLGVWINSGPKLHQPGAHPCPQGPGSRSHRRFVKAIMEAMPVGDPLAEGGHIGPVVNKAQYEKIQGLIQSGIDQGAKLETGGTGLPSNVNRGYYVKPTVFSGVTTDMRIAQEEIFGPVASIISYKDLDEAIEIANDTEYGLSAAISGDPAKAAAEVAPKLRAGTVAINNWGPTRARRSAATSSRATVAKPGCSA
jgi:aldehyde dehydrogenase (NAD+)